MLLLDTQAIKRPALGRPLLQAILPGLPLYRLLLRRFCKTQIGQLDVKVAEFFFGLFVVQA